MSLPVPIVAVAVTATTCGLITYCYRANRRKRARNRPVEALKNALLTFALALTRPGDFDNENMKYGIFDGSRLPMLSGAQIEHACFTYIIDKEEFRKDPWYTPIMHDKLMAIDKYIERHLATDDDVARFFEQFVNIH